jgi:DNA-binding MarR family transcriptional regulator
MKLEDEIKQSHFKTPWHKAVLNILYTGNWLTDRFMAVAKKHGINDQHYNILRILRGRHPECTCPGEIKDVLFNKRGDLTRLLDKLVKMELVNRSINAENRRKVDLKITQKGLDFLEQIDPEVDVAQYVLQNLTEQEAVQLSALLDKIRE